MSHIAKVIDELLVENKMNATTLSKASGIERSQISRIRSGQQIWVSQENLARLAESFCAGQRQRLPQTHARLVCARLHDECFEPGARFVSIKLELDLERASETNLQPADKPILPPRIQENLDLIASQVTKKRLVRDMIEAIATQCRAWHNSDQSE
jgi:DNA-binding Xre family transcriptional regulator